MSELVPASMRVGVLIPTRGVVMASARRPDVDLCWRMARLADGAGYDAVWVGDSIVAKPRLEAVTTLAYLAGHRDMNITKRYVHPQEQTIRTAMNRAHEAQGGRSSGHTAKEADLNEN